MGWASNKPKCNFWRLVTRFGEKARLGTAWSAFLLRRVFLLGGSGGNAAEAWQYTQIQFFQPKRYFDQFRIHGGRDFSGIQTERAESSRRGFRQGIQEERPGFIGNVGSPEG